MSIKNIFKLLLTLLLWFAFAGAVHAKDTPHDIDKEDAKNVVITYIKLQNELDFDSLLSITEGAKKEKVKTIIQKQQEDPNFNNDLKNVLSNFIDYIIVSTKYLQNDQKEYVQVGVKWKIKRPSRSVEVDPDLIVEDEEKDFFSFHQFLLQKFDKDWKIIEEREQ